MGTEIFPLILFLAKIIIGTVGVCSILVCVLFGIEVIKEKKDQHRREQLKKYILNTLIALTITVIVYVVLIGIGPAFTVLFGS